MPYIGSKELKEFVKQNLFSTVDKLMGCKVVGCKWVFKIKIDRLNGTRQD